MYRGPSSEDSITVADAFGEYYIYRYYCKDQLLSKVPIQASIHFVNLRYELNKLNEAVNITEEIHKIKEKERKKQIEKQKTIEARNNTRSKPALCSTSVLVHVNILHYQYIILFFLH